MIFESERKRRILPSLELMLGAHYGSYNIKKKKKISKIQLFFWIIFCIKIEAVKRNLGKELFQSCV